MYLHTHASGKPDMHYFNYNFRVLRIHIEKQHVLTQPKPQSYDQLKVLLNCNPEALITVRMQMSPLCYSVETVTREMS
jgi:hypothetical protein